MTKDKRAELEDSFDTVLALCRMVYLSAIKMGFSESQAMLLAGVMLNNKMSGGTK